MHTTKTHYQRALALAVLGAGMLLISGCASMNATQVPPVSVGEVIYLSQQHMPPEAIIQKMRDSGTVYQLTAAQLADLRAQGVDNSVINYMQGTYLAQAEWMGRQYADPWGPRFGVGFGHWGHHWGTGFGIGF